MDYKIKYVKYKEKYRLLKNKINELRGGGGPQDPDDLGSPNVLGGPDGPDGPDGPGDLVFFDESVFFNEEFLNEKFIKEIIEIVNLPTMHTILNLCAKNDDEFKNKQKIMILLAYILKDKDSNWLVNLFKAYDYTKFKKICENMSDLSVLLKT